MRRLILASLALLAGSALFAPTTASAQDYRPYECHAFVWCTVYGPDGQPITSYEEIRAKIDELRP